MNKRCLLTTPKTFIQLNYPVKKGAIIPHLKIHKHLVFTDFKYGHYGIFCGYRTNSESYKDFLESFEKGPKSQS